MKGSTKKAFYILLAVVLTLIIALSAAYLGYYIKIAEAVTAAKKYSAVYEVDYSTVLGIIYTESKFDKNAVSPVGAVGLMQLMPSTARWIYEQDDFGEYNQDDLFNVDNNIKLGCWYFAYVYAMFNDTDWALAAYNGGYNRVITWQLEGIEVKNIPITETREYVVRVNKSAKLLGVLY